MKSVFRRKKTHLLAVGIGLLSFAYSSFFLQGIRLFDNDYNQWITWAREDPLTKTLSQTFNPILAEWNIQFRPFQVLVFKVLFPLFGYDASGYYYLKSFLLAVFCVVYFFFLRRFLQNTTIAALSALLLALSSSTFTSFYWVSDFIILSEILALLVYALFLRLELRQAPPRRFAVLAIFALMFLLTLLCDRTKANGKLIPAILFFYIVLIDWRKLKRYGLVLVLMLFVVVPVKEIIKNPIPQFIHASSERSVEVFSWQPASWEKFWLLFGQDFEPFSLRYLSYPPISILAILGFPIVYGAGFALLVVLGRHFRREKTESAIRTLIEARKTPIGQVVVFLSMWALVNVAALASYPTLPQHFQARYAISVLIPLVPLLLWLIYRATIIVAPSKNRLPAIIVSILVGTQLLFHANYTYRMRNDFATFMIASDGLRDYVAKTFRNSFFFYFNLPVLSFRPTHDGNQFFSVWRELNVTEEARKHGATLSDCYLISRYPITNPFLAVHKSFPGRSNSLYDRIFNGGTHPRYRNTMYLYEVRTTAKVEKQ
jgi:hypothetical protein